MEGRVGLVFKLPRKEPAVLVGELSSLSQIKKVYIYNLTCFLEMAVVVRVRGVNF